MKMHRSRYGIAMALLLAVGASANAQEKRRVYVLHSGMHIILAPADKNHAARTMKELLGKRGIAERDLIAMESPFPTATWENAIPREGLVIYLEAADPASRSSHDAYVRLHKVLQANKVGKDDDIVWIGHSAGGQIGMSMAHLAHNLNKYPDLAKKTQPYHFDTVITLGTAVGANPVPAGVKLRHYYSAGDTMIFVLSKHGNVVSEAMKSKVVFRPCHELGPNAKVRVFPGIEHPWWYTDDDVLARILAEFEPAYCPAWRKVQADISCGVGLSQLMSKALESELRISLEEQDH